MVEEMVVQCIEGLALVLGKGLERLGIETIDAWVVGAGLRIIGLTSVTFA